jgi:valyl-tRNA synthetase
MGEVPFKDVLFHGLIRDSEGRKFSKSLGNGIDPLDVIEKYGSDALRLMLVTGNAAGNDMRFYWEKVEACRNFANKLWNASRFVLMNFEDTTDIKVDMSELTPADKWILSKVNTLAKDVTENMDHYDLGIAATKIQDFCWEEYCDWYIEMVKPRLYNKEDATRNAALWTLKTVLMNALKLLHPFMPFLTEELFMHVQEQEETIMLASWPVYTSELDFKNDEIQIETIKAAVRNIRNIRAEMNVPPSKKAKVYVVSTDDGIIDTFNNGKVFFGTLAYASEVNVQKDKTGIASDAVSVVIANATIYMPFAELVDIEKEIDRLQKEAKRLKSEVDRVDKKLSNQGFVAKAPASVIEEEKAKQQNYINMLKQVEQQLAHLAK